MLGICSLGLMACSSGEAARPLVPTRQATTTVVDSPFCNEAVAFNDFVDVNGSSLLEPLRAQRYLADALGLLDDLRNLAPDEVVDDLDVITSAYRSLDDALALVDYDLLLVEEATFQSDVWTEASVSLDDHLFRACGFDSLAALPFEGEAPDVLSNDELTDLVDGDVDNELVGLLVEQFVAEFGLDQDAAQCLASSMDSDSVTAIASGGAVTDEVAADFAGTLEQCNIDANSLLD